MLSAALLLLANSLFLTLRLTGDTGSFPKPLSAGEERMYLERSLAGDLEARNILVEHNLRLVAHIIKKYYTQAAEQEDLISIGTIGLIKAVDTFRPERKIRLATYASRCVENEVLMYFRSRKKLQGEVSLSDAIDTDKEGGSLYLLDVVGTDDTMLSDLQDREEQLLLRRLVRDCLFRGHGAAFTLGLWGHVCAGEDRYIKPYKPRANLLLDTTHTYEVCLWRTVLDTMPADPALTATQARQLAALREKFAAFPALGTELVPQNSMLREFIGK